MSDSLFSIEGKIALITGAGGGIGSALSRAFVSRGATVAAVEQDPEMLAALAIKLENERAPLHSYEFDLKNIDLIPELVERIIARAGRIDVLVNNAGVNRPGLATEVDQADWDATLTVNLKACFFLAQEVARHMQRLEGGRIINLASQLGLVGRNNCAPYTASKGGLILLTKSLSLEWAKHNILVNAIAPGPLRTPMTEPFLQDPQLVQEMNAAIPLGRVGSPEEIVGAALLLASDAGSFITGSVLVVDGGYTAI